MVAQRKKVADNERVGNLKLRKETLRDLDPKSRAKEIKGGSERLSCTPAPRAWA